MSDVNMEAQFSNYTSFTAAFETIYSIPVDDDVTAESSHAVKSSGIFNFVIEKQSESFQKIDTEKAERIAADALLRQAYNNDHERIVALSLTKQDKLIDGENIKTINGEGILGSGDISIPVPDVNKAYVDQQNNAQNIVIETKQEILVSGQNIKTINGQSVIGEGDIHIEGGSGMQTYKVEFDGSHIKKDGVILTYSQLVNKYNDPNYFLYCEGYGLTMIPSLPPMEGDEILEFICTWIYGGNTTVSRLIINSNEQIKYENIVIATKADIPDYSDRLTMMVTDESLETEFVEVSDKNTFVKDGIVNNDIELNEEEKTRAKNWLGVSGGSNNLITPQIFAVNYGSSNWSAINFNGEDIVFKANGGWSNITYGIFFKAGTYKVSCDSVTGGAGNIEISDYRFGEMPTTGKVIMGLDTLSEVFVYDHDAWGAFSITNAYNVTGNVMFKNIKIEKIA